MTTGIDGIDRPTKNITQHHDSDRLLRHRPADASAHVALPPHKGEPTILASSSSASIFLDRKTSATAATPERDSVQDIDNVNDNNKEHLGPTTGADLSLNPEVALSIQLSIINNNNSNNNGFRVSDHQRPMGNWDPIPLTQQNLELLLPRVEAAVNILAIKMDGNKMMTPLARWAYETNWKQLTSAEGYHCCQMWLEDDVSDGNMDMGKEPSPGK